MSAGPHERTMIPGDPSRRRRSAPRARTVVPGLRVEVVDGRGRALSARWLDRWLAAVVPSRLRGEVSIALVGDRRVRGLNRDYRASDYATDVLSFPVDDALHSARTQPPFLGDIVIATGVAKRQARAAGHSERTEVRILALHGLLHLIGYDHEHDDGAMARAERRLRRKGGLREGLIERARLTRRATAQAPASCRC
jgi:probable rRNA maturation factor